MIKIVKLKGVECAKLKTNQLSSLFALQKFPESEKYLAKYSQNHSLLIVLVVEVSCDFVLVVCCCFFPSISLQSIEGFKTRTNCLKITDCSLHCSLL